MTIEAQLSAMLFIKRPVYNRKNKKWVVEYVENDKTLIKEFVDKEDALVYYYLKLHEIEDKFDKTNGRSHE